MEFAHRSVLLEEVLEGLHIRPAGTYVDGTLGGGGHALAVAERLTTGRLIGIDQDADAIAAATGRLAPVRDRVTIAKSNYTAFDDVLDLQEVGQVDGILLDLGVSSFQLDEASRGFSYREDAPLDMRMDRQGGKSAADVVNTYSFEELRRILWDYGEERCAPNIARAIIRERENAPITTTLQLSAIVSGAMPAKMKGPGTGHPAKRSFQAIRIEVNRELEVLEDSIDRMIARLTPGGRLCIITFHSLEDRIVKQKFRMNEKPCVCPPDFPVCVCRRVPAGTVITRKPILPGAAELAENPRAKSAKLRIFEHS